MVNRIIIYLRDFLSEEGFVRNASKKPFKNFCNSFVNLKHFVKSQIIKV